MKIYTSLEEIPHNLKAYITIGKFDGIHLGHLKVLKKLISLADKQKCTTLLITFSDNPFNPLKNKYRITIFEKKFQILKKIGIQNWLEISLTRIKKINYIQFLNKIDQQFNCLGIIASEKLRIGFEKKGNCQKIKEFYKKKNKKAIFISSLAKDKKKISSSTIRKLLEKGEVDQANQLLYIPFSIRGKVKPGRKLGSQIGFPTTNFYYPLELVQLKLGSYITLVRYQNQFFSAMTFIGYPFLKGEQFKKKIIETNIFNFNAIIYEEEIEIFFLTFLGKAREIKSKRMLGNLLLDYKKKTQDFFIQRKSLVRLIKKNNLEK